MSTPPTQPTTKEASPLPIMPTASQYQPPTSGWLSHTPESCHPYLQLMRLDRFNGYWYFWLPHFYGTLLAAISQKPSIPEFLRVNAILVWAVLIMRGATCTWNDTVDAPFDRRVSRCKDRPVARGAVPVWGAFAFTGFQAGLSLGAIVMLPSVCFLYAVPAVVGWIVYPLAKRVTYYPQIVLGFPMAWGVFMGAASMGSDPLNAIPLLKAIQQGGDVAAGLSDMAISSPAIVAFYFANVVWTLLYEIIYSHQDAPEDAAAGVKNIVLLYADVSGAGIKYRTKTLLVKLAVCQVLLLGLAGALGGYSPVYFTGTVAGAAVSSAAVLSKVRLGIPSNCAWWFKVGCCLSTGSAMASGLLGEYLLAVLGRH